MKTLEEHNTERIKQFTKSTSHNKTHPNGIVCPKCGDELLDTNPMMMLTSSPPQKDVHCPVCGYCGYRIA
jgi:uncharacterized protein with PIN domain